MIRHQISVKKLKVGHESVFYQTFNSLNASVHNIDDIFLHFNV